MVYDGSMEIGAQARVTAPDGSVSEHPMTRTESTYTFAAEVLLDDIGVYTFVVDAWVDRAATIQSKILRKRSFGQATTNEEASLRELRIERDRGLLRAIGRARSGCTVRSKARRG